MAQLSPSDLLRDTENVINAAFDRRDLRGLRMMWRDVRKWTKALSAARRMQLEELLQSAFGVGLVNSAHKDKQTVSQTLKRGRIDGDEEHRILTNRAEEIYAEVSKRSELKQINSLLAEYESTRKLH